MAGTQGILGNQSSSFLGVPSFKNSSLLNTTSLAAMPSSITPSHPNSQFYPKMVQRNWGAIKRNEMPN